MANTTGFYRDRDGVYVEKSPGATLDYALNYATWLDTDTISSSSFAVEGISGDTAPLTNAGDSNTTTATSISLSGGSINNVYTVTNTIVTAGGLTEVRNFRVTILDRSI